MKKDKELSTKEFVEKEMNEIRKINEEVKRRTRKLILTAFLANLILMVVILFFGWYIQHR